MSGNKATCIKPRPKPNRFSLRSAYAALALSVALAACTLPQQILYSLIPDGTFPTLLANLRGLDRSNQEQLAELEQRGDWPGVVAFAERNIQREKRIPEWWFVKGYALGHMNQWPAARDAFAESVRLDPDSLQAWQMLGQSQRLSGDASRSAQTLERVLSMSRESPTTFYLLGEAYAELGRSDRAIAAYREALRLDPTLAEALYGLGAAHARAGERTQQRAIATRLAKLDPALAEKLLSLQ